jgi:tetratricopeptide (TPR) repeat protein
MSAEAIERTLDEAAAHYAAGRVDEAARGYGALEAAEPGDFRAVYGLAVIDIKLDRLQSALVRLRRTLRLNPTLFSALFSLGRVSETLGLWREAAHAYARALALRPSAADVRGCLAAALCVIGRIDESLANFRAITTDPRFGAQALARLAIIRPEGVTDDELTAIRLASERSETPASTRIDLLFALGEVLDARGAYDEAFAAFEAGNRAKYATLAAGGPESDPQLAARDFMRSIGHLKATFPADFLAARRHDGDPNAAPIFIVGMPRSGSTLIEQILTSHPAVQGMGESPITSETLQRFGIYDPAISKAPGFFRAMAEDYLARMQARGWTRKSRLIDKTLENYLHVGVIHLMFPNAVILHSVRDPLDTCVACYRQLFNRHNETLYDLAQIGETYVRYRDVMEHWARVLPGRVIDFGYEALLAEPEARIRWLVTEACGLTWDSRCMQFHKTERAVTTASAVQVRRPLFSTSQSRWRRYESRLGPLIEALGPYAAAAATLPSDQADQA